MSQREIDPFRARELRRSGLAWRAVAERLSIEAGRHPPFQWQSVVTAMRLTFGTSMVKPKRWVA